jgi:TRAP-type C4-dicarboxylate transport system substrate-binding protein
MVWHRWLATVAALLLTNSTASLAADYKLTNVFDRTNPATPIIVEAFARHLETAANGRMKVQITGPETVPSFEQLQPVAAGVFDFGITSGNYHSGTITAATTLDGLNADLAKLREVGMIDEIDKRYQRLGLKLIAVAALRSNSYQIILRDPVGPSGDLKGRKLRATSGYRPLVMALGASEVVMPNAETYAALEKKVVDGAAWTSIGILAAKFYEVNKYMLRPTFGSSHILVLMNLNRWNGLSEQDRKVVLEAGRMIEESWATNFPRITGEEEATLIKDHGMQLTHMREDIGKRANAIMAEGAWVLAAGRNARMTEELRQFARSKGLIN